jgi:hypothetical protein
MYAKILNGEIIQYPVSEHEIRTALPHVSFAIPFTPSEPFVRVIPIAPPETSSEQVTVEAPPAFSNGQWRQCWEARPLTPADQAARLEALKAQMLARLATRRWEVETGGVMFEAKRYGTDAVAQTKYVGALLAFQSDPAASVQWKTADGSFVRLEQNQILALVAAVRQHVQRCFDLEAMRAEQIRTAREPAFLARVDIENGW